LSLFESGDPGRIRAAAILLNRILKEWPIESELAMCFLQLAECYSALGELDGAINSYRKCFAQEKSFPGSLTSAWSNFAQFVVDRRVKHLYGEVLAILAQHEGDIDFPVLRFVLHGARAIILDDRASLDESRREAEVALKHAERKHSGMTYHATLGLVRQDNPWIPKLKTLLNKPQL
jgi:hypothetical protein